MGGNFSYNSTAQAWQDTTAQQNPKLQVFNWAKYLSPKSFNTAYSNSITLKGGEVVDLPITAPLGLIGSANSPILTVTANPVKANVYRFTPSASAQFVPVNNLSGATTIAITQRTDGNYVFTLSAANLAIPPDGRIFIPGVASGDTTGPFNEANVGNWRIISVAGNYLSFIAAPIDGQFGTVETVAGVVSPQFQAYDVEPDLGWLIYSNQGPWQGVYAVVGLTSEWFELTTPVIPWQLPGSYPSKSGSTQLWYIAQKYPKFVRIEADATVEVSGMSGPPMYSIIPWSDTEMGWIEWSGANICPVPLQIVNSSPNSVTVNVFVVH